MLTPNPNIPNIPNTADVATPLSSGPARPVVLFPVRLETRFFKLTDGSSELRVRVYPDSVHIDSHEPALTAEEQTWGRHFWEQTWAAGDDEERRKSAWRQLADRFDPPRAAWVARTLMPLNPQDRTANKPPVFPSPATKAEAWTRAPMARMLPNQWVVLGYKDGKLIVNARGKVIVEDLKAGPDPEAGGGDSIPPDQLAIDVGMKWMVDFDAAEEKGMGIRARMSQQNAAAGLDFLLVLGVKDSAGGTTDWTPRLAELLDAHRYTDGLSFVPQGTPSNNTADAPSGFSSADPGHEASYLAELATSVFQPGDRSNGDVLTSALGLANAKSVFANLPNAAAKEQLDARQMNTAMWRATWGYFLLQMLGVDKPGESPLLDADIAWARSHFIDYVRANGPLPALRIGKQPYGILPVTSLDAWRPQVVGQRDEALHKLLVGLRNVWRRNYTDVPRLGRTEDIDQEKGIDRDLAEVLSMDARSSSYSVRNLMGRHYMEHLWVLLSADFYQDVWPPVDEPPAEPEPYVEDPMPEGLSKNAQAAWVKAQRAAALAAQRAHQQWAAAVVAYDRRLAFIAAKHGYTASWWATQEQRAGALLQTPGVRQNPAMTWQPRLARGVFSPPIAKLNGALVQAVKNKTLLPNYIESLLAARDLNAIRNGTLQPPSKSSLLYLLLRHSMLLEYGAAGHLLRSGERREQELVNMPGRPATQTVWEQLNRDVNVSGVGNMKLGSYLLGFLPSGEPDTARNPELKPLSDFRASLTHLKSLDADRLEELMTGTLDLCSHRLDAWITSLATKRLTEMRNASPTGMLFGGYGWIMNLKPAAGQANVPAPPGEQAPVFQTANQPGFIHTPSLTHAAAAAILRSGHMAHAGYQQPNDLLAIDLSSERVRLATWLLDGVRQGQPLGALLGYRFERRLQEGQNAKFISAFREMAPLAARKLEQTSEPAGAQPLEAIAANNVVDGLQLHHLWQQTQNPPSQAPQKEQDFFSGLPAMTADEKGKVRSELMALNDSVDAVSDALMAESVYQVVRGNPLRAASTVESIAGGETPPPELEVVRTPRTGIALTHRLVTLFSGEPVLSPEWTTATNLFRANAEPHLNAWAARLLGNPLKVRCVIEQLEPATGKVLATKEIRISQLGLSPLDFIYAMEGGEGGQQAEIEQRLFYTMMKMNGGFAPGSLLRVNPNRRPGWESNELSYGEFSELLRKARKLITSARAIEAGDLDLPERSANFSADVVELEKRAASADWISRTRNDLKALLMTPDTVNLETLRGVLLRAAGLGIAGAVPLSAAGNSPADRQTILAQSASILSEVDQRTKQLEALFAGFNANPATLEARRDYALARMQVIFGKGFVVLPRFSAANAEELGKALADSVKVQGGDPLASTSWFQQMARVRDGVARLNASLNYSEALNTGERLNLNIAQLPYSTTDRWVGLPLKAGQTMPGGKLSLVVQSGATVDVRQPLAGLLIDEWVEVVPSATETTGIALQCDRPNATPPQTILIAVPPEVGVPWTIWSMQQVLLETLDLARIRAVDPDALDEVGHYFPAMYFAINTVGDTVSTDFTKINS